MVRRHLLCAFLALALAMPVEAQERPAPAPDEEVVFEEEVVEAPREPAAEVITSDGARMKRASNASDLAVEELGVAGVRRGGNAPEPVIRGLGYERVQTQIGGVPIHGGCPASMDPAATYIPSHAIQSVRILKGLPSVTAGPAGTAGRILVDTDYERAPESDPEIHTFAKGYAESARQGGGLDAGVKGGNRWFDGSLSFGYTELNDYQSPSDIEVPADFTDRSLAASAGFRPREDHRWSNTYIHVETGDVDYPALPMDSTDSDFDFYQTGYRIRYNQGALRQLKVEGGLALVDHMMDNHLKPNSSMMLAETPTTSDTYAGKIQGNLQLGEALMLMTGIDFFTLQRDGTRRRQFLTGPSAGQVFFDHIWPDASQTNFGLFAEIDMPLSAKTNLRVGLRGDLMTSDAEAVDDPSLRGRSVRANFVDFYGPEAAEVKQDDVTGSGNVLLEWQATEQLAPFAGVGVSSRPAGVTERYYAFAPAPGGFLIGNPTLSPEVKYEIDAGLNWRREKLQATLSAFAAEVKDYIYQTQIAFQDVNGDGTADIVRGYQNIDATLYGAELGLVFDPLDHIRIPISAMAVVGRNDSDDRDLPEIPPLEARAALVFYGGERLSWWGEFGGRFVARQDKIDVTFPEDETAGFEVFHLRGGLKIAAFLELEAGVENLFNEEYNEHLTRESAFNYGHGLGAGDEIPEPERSFYLTLRAEF